MSQAPSRNRQIMGLALPIIGGMISQNVMNLVDTAMVGALGDHALAGVGIASFTNFMAGAFITGLSTGVQAMAARRVGEGRDDAAVPLNGGLLLAISMAVPWSMLLFWFAPSFFPYLNSDPHVIAQGVPYLQARIAAIAGVGMNFCFRGYWNGVNLSKLYMRTLILMHVCNICLNYVLIFGKFGFPALGTLGAGLGTAISTYLGTIYYLVQGTIYARKEGFMRGIPDRSTIGSMLRLSVPTGIQQLFFAAGMTTLFWIIGKVGTAELAAANVLINLLLVALLPAIGFGISAATLVGQALGRKDPDDASQWAWDVCKVASVVVGLIALPGLLFPSFFLKFFIHNPQTLSLAILPLRLTAATIIIDTIGMVLMNALLGAGDSKSVMVISVSLQWFLFLPAIYLIGPVLGYGLVAIWLAQVVYRGIQSGIFAALWKRGSWKEIKL